MDSRNPQVLKTAEWSDRRCLEVAAEETFPAIVKDLKVQKNIISRYLNFYLGGKILKGLSARDMAFAAIAIMPISPHSEEFIWTESEYSEDGNLFFVTPDDKLKYDIDTVMNKRDISHNPITNNELDIDKDNVENTLNNKELAEQTVAEEESHIKETDANTDCVITSDGVERQTNNNSDGETSKKSIEDHIDHENDTKNNLTSDKAETFATNLQWYRVKRDETSNKEPTEEKKYDPVKNAAFCMYFNQLLDTWETSMQSRISLKYFFAMVALFTMRGKVKTYQNLTKYFYTKLVSSLVPDAIEYYTPPHQTFLKKSWKSFRDSDRRNQVMFAKLVIISLSKPDRMNHYGKSNIIKFAVLSHTVYFGMGIISMLQQIATYDMEFKILFKLLYTNETAASWNRVNDFFKKYLTKGAGQYTFHWAGVIESDSFKHLSCTNNYEFAVVLAVFIEKLRDGMGVWQSAWVSKGNDLENWKQLGYKLYDEYKKNQHQLLLAELHSLLGGRLT